MCNENFSAFENLRTSKDGKTVKLNNSSKYKTIQKKQWRNKKGQSSPRRTWVTE